MKNMNRAFFAHKEFIMKFFKKVAIAAMTLSLALSTCALASCTDGKDSSSTEASVCYTFIVKNADGSAAQNVNVQLCAYQEDGVTLGTCYMPVAVNADGKCEYTAAPEAGVYEIHLLDTNNESVAFDGPTTTPAEYGEITLTLK